VLSHGLVIEAAPLAPPTGGVAISARALTHSYGRGAGLVPVLRGVDLDIASGSHVALQGPSGAGKSTLLSLIGGLERPGGGALAVGGHDLTVLRARGLARYRRVVVGFVFQHFGLVDVLSAHENVMLAMSLSGVAMAERRRRALESLDSVGLGGRASHRPGELSGGERQRVSIARAIVNRPALILADEPTGNLDDEAAVRILDLLDELRHQHGCTMLVVTHSALVAARAERQLRLRDGMVQA
jgi:putative ABC transport system ATP-binding protein